MLAAASRRTPDGHDTVVSPALYCSSVCRALDATDDGAAAGAGALTGATGTGAGAGAVGAAGTGAAGAGAAAAGEAATTAGSGLDAHAQASRLRPASSVRFIAGAPPESAAFPSPGHPDAASPAQVRRCPVEAPRQAPPLQAQARAPAQARTHRRTPAGRPLRSTHVSWLQILRQRRFRESLLIRLPAPGRIARLPFDMRAHQILAGGIVDHVGAVFIRE
jgi:hypothetical protein